MQRVLIRLVADALLVAAALFIAAGTLAWPRAWILIAVLLTVRIASAVAVFRVNPALLRDRAKLPVHAQQPLADRLLVLSVLGTGFIGLPMIAGLDVFRWHAMSPPSPMISALGLVLFTLGWTIKGLALRTNAFATSVIRMQRERDHVLVDRGVYGMVRHPFYSGTVLVVVGTGLWLGSSLAALLSIVPIALVAIRLQVEERFLRRELPGYADYALRVRRRLIPGIW
jgi:protein-S-isoprenylcysteine O-methyltransferase Ste14